MSLFKIRISGNVHGVGFRFSAQKKARELCVVGFVRNEQDGTVYIEAEGNDSALAKFIAWCRKGPQFSVVENVKIETGPEAGYLCFDVRF